MFFRLFRNQIRKIEEFFLIRILKKYSLKFFISSQLFRNVNVEKKLFCVLLINAHVLLCECAQKQKSVEKNI